MRQRFVPPFQGSFQKHPPPRAALRSALGCAAWLPLRCSQAAASPSGSSKNNASELIYGPLVSVPEIPSPKSRYTYTAFGALDKEYQEHEGKVDGSSLHVDYAHAAAAGTYNGITSVFTKGMRPKSIKHPNGRLVHYTYDTGGGQDDALSRVAALVGTGWQRLAMVLTVGHHVTEIAQAFGWAELGAQVKGPSRRDGPCPNPASPDGYAVIKRAMRLELTTFTLAT